jgi:hypothetical protein
LEVISVTPLAAMEPESPRQASKSEAVESSARSSDTESAMPKLWEVAGIPAIKMREL